MAEAGWDGKLTRFAWRSVVWAHRGEYCHWSSRVDRQLIHHLSLAIIPISNRRLEMAFAT